MSGQFSFSDTVKNDAFMRQNGRCAGARCHRKLTFLEEHAHHVVPQQCGRGDQTSDRWLKTSDNCVILCSTCHTAYHGHGHFGTVVSGPDVFQYSHDADRVAHLLWLKRVSTLYQAMLSPRGRAVVK